MMLIFVKAPVAAVAKCIEDIENCYCRSCEMIFFSCNQYSFYPMKSKSFTTKLDNHFFKNICYWKWIFYNRITLLSVFNDLYSWTVFFTEQVLSCQGNILLRRILDIRPIIVKRCRQNYWTRNLSIKYKDDKEGTWKRITICAHNLIGEKKTIKIVLFNFFLLNM